MRSGFAFAVGMSLLAAGAGERYGIAPDPKTYPQASPKEAMASALKAAEAGRFDYLVAQLADPEWVDDRVKRLYGGRFDSQVEDTRARLGPPTLKLLRRFLTDGAWQEQGERASARLKDVPDSRVHLRRLGGRWYLEHRFAPGTEK
jgi:hypothetical protein